MSGKTDAERERTRWFNAGYLIAVANIMNMHNEDTIAEDVLGALGEDRSVLNGLDLADYDLKPLRKLFGEIERKAAYDRRKVA